MSEESRERSRLAAASRVCDSTKHNGLVTAVLFDLRYGEIWKNCKNVLPLVLRVKTASLVLHFLQMVEFEISEPVSVEHSDKVSTD